MFVPQCLFCDHINPAAAKFCNECGEPLHLKPCKECEAINDRAARICYQCGAADPTLDVAPEAVAAATPEVQPPVTATTPEVQPAETTPVTAAQTPDATTDRRPKHRLAAAALPPLVLLCALAVSAYYAYSHPTQLKEWLSAARATVGGKSGETPMSAVHGTSGMPASPAPTVSEGAASVVAGRPAAPTAVNTSVNDTTTAPVRPDGTSAAGVANVDSQAPTPSQTQAAVPPQPHGLTPAQAAPAPQASHVEKKPSAGSKPPAKKSKKPPPKKKPAPAKTTTSSKASAKPAEVPRMDPGN